MTQTANPQLISLQTFNDERGVVEHYSSNELPHIRRVYFVSPSKVGEFRGWHGHMQEAKVFRCLEGEFEVFLAQVEDWMTPRSVRTLRYRMSSAVGDILLVPGGFANAIVSLASGSRMMVMSDKTLAESQNDDYRYDKKCFPLG